MTSKATDAPTRKPGRPPLGKRSLTVAEIKRRYRERKKLEGVREISLMLDQRHLEIIGRISAASGLSKRQTVQVLLDEAMLRLEIGDLVGQNAMLKGRTPDEINAAIRRAMERPYEDIDKA